MILACVMMLSMAVHAQWRVGVTGGTDYNLYTMDMQYESDWTQKNYRHYRELGSYCYDYSLVDGSYLTKKLAEEVGNLIGTHTLEFLSAEKCDANASKTIENVIKTVLGEF